VTYFRGTGPLYCDALEFQIANKAILDTYVPRHSVALFTVCSWAKPFDASFIHYLLKSELQNQKMLDQVDYIHVSSAGVIPCEYEHWEPFVNYDWNNQTATPASLRLLQKRIEQRLQTFLEKFRWKRCYYYFREDSNTAVAVRKIIADQPQTVAFLGQQAATAHYVLYPEVTYVLAALEEVIGYAEVDEVLVHGPNRRNFAFAIKQGVELAQVDKSS